MFQTLILAGLYSLGMFIGFMLIPLFKMPLISEQEGIDMDLMYDQIFLSFKLEDELEEAPDSNLSEEELKQLQEKILHYEIPYIKHKVIMYYDHDTTSFCYYSNSTIIYKYLNIVARKYVLEFGCKQIYKDMTETVKKKEEDTKSGPFVKKATKTMMEKEFNRFHYVGNLHDYKPKLEEVRKVTFSEYLLSCTRESQSKGKD